MSPRQLITLSPSKYAVDAVTGCWNWRGGLTRNGYPTGYAHRRSWELVNGPRPAEHDIHHLCMNTRCVNPDHLDVVHERVHDVEHFLHQRAKIRLEDVVAIRRRGEHGERAADIAAEYGISEDVVRRYWRGERWGDLTGEAWPIMIHPRPCQAPGCVHVAKATRGAKYCSDRCNQRASVARIKARAAQ